MECGGPKVATNALAIPSPVVSMKPFKLFGPGARKRAMMPTMKPITMIQIMFDTMIFPWPLADRRGVSPIHRFDFPPCFNVDAHHRVPTRFKGRAPVALRFPVEPPGDLLLDSARRFASPRLCHRRRDCRSDPALLKRCAQTLQAKVIKVGEPRAAETVPMLLPVLAT